MQIKTYLPIKIMAFLVVSYAFLQALLSYSGIVLIRNISPSLPLGFYYQSSKIKWEKGEIVSIQLPSEIKKKLASYAWFNENLSLLKVVSALPGDRVCRTKNRIKINGRAARKVYRNEFERTGIKEQLGCYRLKSDEFLPLNKNYRHSVDGRYFGALKKTTAKGRVSPIFIYKLGSI